MPCCTPAQRTSVGEDGVPKRSLVSRLVSTIASQYKGFTLHCCNPGNFWELSSRAAGWDPDSISRGASACSQEVDAQEGRSKPQSCWLYYFQLGNLALTQEQSSCNFPLQSADEVCLYFPRGFDSLTALPQSDASITQRM